MPGLPLLGPPTEMPRLPKPVWPAPLEFEYERHVPLPRAPSQARHSAWGAPLGAGVLRAANAGAAAATTANAPTTRRRRVRPAVIPMRTRVDRGTRLRTQI